MGLGVSLDSNRATIYLPMEKGNYIIEPMVRYQWDDYDLDGTRTEAPNVVAVSTEDLGAEAGAIGVGLYRVVTLMEKTRLILGGRLGYQFEEQESQQALAYSTGQYDLRTFKRDIHGPFAAPSIGLEYALTDHIFAGGRASVEYRRMTGDEASATNRKLFSGTVQTFSEERDVTQTSSSTETELYVKYYF